MKISTRLFLYISTLIILTSIGLGYISVRDERSHLMGEARMMARTLARTLAATFKYYHMEDQHQRLGELIHAVMPHDKDAHNLLLNMYDRHGQLINLSFEHGITRQAIQRDRELGDFSKGGSEQIIKDGTHEYFSVVVPIQNSGGELQGAVEILLSFDSINNTIAGLVRKFVAFILLTALLLGLLIYLISRWSITLPIARLKEASEKLGHGDLGLRIEKSGVKELDDLIEEFNRMAHNIERQNSKREQLFSEKINLERGLRHQDKLASIGQLASGLAHEIGTPLNVISGRAEHLLHKLTGNHPGSENLKIIIRQAERITKTMQQMLAFSRKPTAEFSEVYLEKIINDAFSLCQLKQRKNHPPIEIELKLSTESVMVTDHGAGCHNSNSPQTCKRLQGTADARKRPVRYTPVCGQTDDKADAVPCDRLSVMADEDGLRQLFVNLMLNSFHAMKDGGKIIITSEKKSKSSGEVIITYEDNGPGVPPALRDRIFDPFFTTKEVGEGTGLGLFMAQNIVQEHQGRIELDCDFDKGARFIIHLPRQPRQLR
jgi:signal transduction histidine kinase